MRGGPGKNDFFRLQGLEYLEDRVGDKLYKEINGIWTRRIDSTQITANVVDPQTPETVKFDIFRRINTGGSPLNAQEVRHCMTGRRARKILNDLTELDAFRKATHGKLVNHVRMADIEVALRFTTVYLLNDYKNWSGSMADRLNEATRTLEKLSEVEVVKLKDFFRRSMSNSVHLFGEYAFRKWPASEDRKFPINRPLFEVCPTRR